MGKDRTLEIIFVFALTYFYFNALSVLRLAIVGDAVAGLAFALAILTDKFVGNKVLKFLGG